MILLLDVGNTTIKWALLEGRRFRRKGKIEREEHRQLWPALPRPEAIWIASVADPSFNQELTQTFARLWHLFPKFVQSQAEGFGVRNGYHFPERLGVDRWLALIAAFHRYREKLPALIVDCGTAVTIDLLRQDGQHLGGYILPGLMMIVESFESLPLDLKWEAVLPSEGSLSPGRSTEEGIAKGSLLAIAGAITRARLPRWSILLTGGDADYIAPHLRARSVMAPDLVLEGLALVATSRSP